MQNLSITAVGRRDKLKHFPDNTTLAGRRYNAMEGVLASHSSICRNKTGGRGAAPPDARGARNERHPVNGANGEASEQIKCASRSAMRERRSGFDIANCGR